MKIKKTAIDKLEEQIEALNKQKTQLRKEKLAQDREDQKKREANVGRYIFSKSNKGSPEHQALLVSYIQSITSPREKELFEELAVKLGVNPSAEEEVISDESETEEGETINPNSLALEIATDNIAVEAESSETDETSNEKAEILPS